MASPIRVSVDSLGEDKNQKKGDPFSQKGTTLPCQSMRFFCLSYSIFLNDTKEILSVLKVTIWKQRRKQTLPENWLKIQW